MACEPNDLASEARCFTCLPPETHMQVQTYLLATWAGASTDPNVLAELARDWRGIQPYILQMVKTYLLCQIWQGGGVVPVTCGDVTDCIEISGAGDPDANGTYTAASAVLWEAENGYYIEEYAGLYRLRRDDNALLYTTTTTFPCTWETDPEFGTDPAPTGEYVSCDENLNSVTWSPEEDVLVTYDIGGGSVVATMAQFNLIDPTLVIAFAIENQGVDTIINLDELVNLEELRLSGNDLTGIPTLPDSITLLDVSNNDITGVGLPLALPSALEQFFIANNPIEGFGSVTLPSTVTLFDASNCDLTSSPDISGLVGSSIIVDLSDNLLGSGITDIPSGLTELFLQNNDFSGGVGWGGSPDSLTVVNVTDCNMTSADALAFATFVSQTLQPNGTLSMLGNDPPNGAEAPLTALLDAGWTVTFAQLAIPAPVDGVVGGTSLTTLTANWDWPPPATSGRLASITGYEIRWGTSPGVYTLGSDTVSNVTLTYEITGLNDSTTYYIVVRAVAPGDQFYAAGNGPDCPEFEGTTDAP